MLARGALLAFSALSCASALAFVACGSSKRAGNGGECFVANDCQTPLVCVEQRDKTRRCTDNLDSVQGTVPSDGAPPPGADAGQNDGGDEPDPDAGPEEPADSGGGNGGDQ